jgi:hypothetical protein
VPGRGGRRAGAGRPPGSGWKPTVAAMREETIAQMRSIVGSDTDPLMMVVNMALDANLDAQTRLGAASIALPFLYPRLSATQVDARTTVVKIDGAALMDRITARLEHIAEMAAGAETSEPSDTLLAVSTEAAAA